MIGIVTINYNSENEILKYYEYLTKQTYKEWVLVIVDNASRIESLKYLKENINDGRVYILESNENYGYGKGNNLGYKFLKNKYKNIELLLFSNPDIYLKNNKLFEQVMHEYKKSNFDFFGPKILNLDGTIIPPQLTKRSYMSILFHLGNSGIMDRILDKFKCKKKLTGKQIVFSLSGSFFFSTIDAFEKAGMFDENLFLYYEEEVFFRKAEKENLKVVYDDQIEVTHEHSKVVKNNVSVIKRKQIIFQSERYLMKEILKVNNVFYFLFCLERYIEIILLKLLWYLKLEYLKNDE